jgi:hypothetical protein
MTNEYGINVLTENPGGRTSLGRRRGSYDNIKTDLKEAVSGCGLHSSESGYGPLTKW